MKPVLTIEGTPKGPFTIEIKKQNCQGTALFDNQAGHVVEVDLRQNYDMVITVGEVTVTQNMNQTSIMKLVEK
jgi:hypothetical protein